MLDCLEALSMLYMLELTHVHVLFRNSHLANNLNFNVKEPVRVEVEVYVDFATSLIFKPVRKILWYKCMYLRPVDAANVLQNEYM